jgi:hypothetical protein
MRRDVDELTDADGAKAAAEPASAAMIASFILLDEVG